MSGLSLTLVASTFGVILVAELPDKTALASLVLATSHPVRAVIFGAWLAFLVQTAVDIAAGKRSHPVAIAARPGRCWRWVRGIRGHGLAAKGVRGAGEGKAGSRQGSAASPTALGRGFRRRVRYRVGDLTQLATGVLVAQTHEPISVAVGAVAALWSVTVSAAVAGAQLGRPPTAYLLNRVSAVVFFVVGSAVIVTARR